MDLDYFSSLPNREPISIIPQGQVQSNRGLKALSVDYFSVEERQFTDWIKYIRKYAEKIHFINSDTLSVNGNWADAIPSDEQAASLQQLLEGKPVKADIKELASRTDIAALLSFYKMMQIPLEQFNRFTKRHLDYYYFNVLGFKANNPMPDQAHLVVQLSDNVNNYTLPSGSKFSGGEDASGKPLIYESLKPVLLNRAVVDRIFTLSNLSDSGKLLFNYGQNEDQDYSFPEQGLLTFGELPVTENTNTTASTLANERHRYPEQGFLITSPTLYLSSGVRTISLDFKPKFTDDELVVDFADFFTVSISTVEGEITLSDTTEHCDTEYAENKVKFTLHELFPPIGLFEESVRQLPLPYIAFSLKHEKLEEKDNEAFINSLRQSLYGQIDLEIDVSNASGIFAEFESQVLDTVNPFYPFGYSPVKNSKMHLVHPELLIKPIKSAALHFDWQSAPDNWNDHYHAFLEYYKHTGDPTNDYTIPRVNVHHSDQPDIVLQGASIFNSGAAIEDVQNNSDGNTVQPNHSKPSVTFIPSLIHGEFEYTNLPLDAGKVRTWPKWFTLEITENDFGHNDYALVSQYAAFQNSSKIQNDKLKEIIEVKPPYTPLLNSLTLSYQSHTTFVFDQESVSSAVRHIHPLGYPAMLAQQPLGFELLPSFDALGYLYIGLSNVELPAQLRLYFQLDPVDGSNIESFPVIDFHYLSNSGWQFFDSTGESRAKIVEDTTYKLLDSGIVTFQLPEFSFDENFIDPERLWIRVSIQHDNVKNIAGINHANYSRIRAVYAQGISVKLVTDEYDPSHYVQPLPESSIDSILFNASEIEEVTQPFPSFGAKTKESQDSILIRASERLRHKNRALTAWDYEQLVLQKFPELYMARCYQHPNKVTNDIYHVALVVVPFNHNPSVIQPKVPLYLKRMIQAFLSEVSPEGVQVEVLDPEYEEVEIECLGQINPVYDTESVEEDLNQILVNYMTPWNKVGESLNLGQDFYLTQFVPLLENHPAVDMLYVVRGKKRYLSDGIEISQDYRGSGNVNNRISPSHPGAFLVPAKQHKITLFNHHKPVFEGVGIWRIEKDFKVG